MSGDCDDDPAGVLEVAGSVHGHSSSEAELRCGRLVQQFLKQYPDGWPAFSRALPAAMEHWRKERDAAQAETEKLFRQTPGMTVPEATAYLQEHPPSPAAIMHLIVLAQDDARQQGHPPAPSDAEFEHIVEQAVASARSEAASKAAKSKNSEARGWLRAQWKAHGSEFNGRKDFVRVMYPTLCKQFDVQVKADQVYREWLKGI